MNYSNIKKQDDQREIKFVFILPKDTQNLEDISNDISSNNNNDGMYGRRQGR